MVPARHPRLSFAMLLVACLCWGGSFPVIKALGQWWSAAEPGLSSWAVSMGALAWRFLAAGLLLAAILGRRLLGTTAGEVRQAAELAALSAIALVLQMDSMAYTSASSSAFLAQGYAILLPLWIAVATRRMPHPLIWLSVLLVLAGSAVLGGVDAGALGFGRGELEAVGSAIAFTLQILVVESPRHAGNQPWRMSALSFLFTGLLMLVPAAILAPQAASLLAPLHHGGALSCLALLVLLPTLGGTGLMFAFQGGVGAVTAGVLYCSLPVFAALAAMFAPALLSDLLGIAYADEQLHAGLLLGGALIVGAVVLAQIAPRSSAPAINAKESPCPS